MPPILTRSNRLTGLLQEINDALRDEDSALELWRAHKTLWMLSTIARSRSSVTESATKEMERVTNKRPKRRWRFLP